MAAWQEIRSICDELERDADAIIGRQLRRIRAELPAYHRLPEGEHRAGIAGQTAGLLTALREAGTASVDDLAAGRQLGASRARQGFEVTTVMQAFQAGCSEVWDELVHRSSGASADLVTAASVIWEWVHVVSTAVAEGHAAALTTAHAGRQVVRWQFVTGVLAGGQDDAQVESWSRHLDLDPHLGFQVVCTPAKGWTDAEVHDLTVALDEGPARAHASVVDDLLCVVGQRPTADVLAGLGEPDVVGIGMVRAGPRGVQRSAVDAVRALGLARLRGRPVSWADAWFWVELAPSMDRLDVLLTPFRALDPVKHAPLSATVSAYAASGFSLAKTARLLSVHANSVGYRLGRWRELTGWDPQTLDGLTRSLAYLELVGTSPAGAGSEAPVQTAVDEQ